MTTLKSTREARPKKPKARRMWANTYPSGQCVAYSSRSKATGQVCKNLGGRTTPVAVLDVSDEAALIEVVARAIFAEWDTMSEFRDFEDHRDIFTAHARAALTALGVLPKRRGK